MSQKDRRTSKQKSDTELYQAGDIKHFIEQERREDELSRLQEVRAQKRLWWRVIVLCFLLNMVFLGLALWGAGA